jgi:hypothetical protein
MDRKMMWLLGAVLALVVVGGGIAAAGVGDVEDERTPDASLTGTALARATEAALAHTGGGTVIESEVGDDGAAYGVEIRLDDGTVVEVGLDAQFNVLGREIDDDGARGSESSND